MHNMYATYVCDMCCLHTCMVQDAAQVFLACMHYFSVLHTCKLLVFLICATCIHAYYYSAAYMLLTHMQATVLHTRCLHTCKLLVFLICAACIHAYYYSAAYMLLTHMQATVLHTRCLHNMQATSVPHMCSLHTCILLQCCIHYLGFVITCGHYIILIIPHL